MKYGSPERDVWCVRKNEHFFSKNRFRRFFMLLLFQNKRHGHMKKKIAPKNRAKREKTN